MTTNKSRTLRSPFNDTRGMDRLLKSVRKALPGEFAVACIGSDKMLADCLGPICGTILHQKGFQAYGTLEAPINRENLTFRIEAIRLEHPGQPLLVVDAARAAAYNVGDVLFLREGIQAGSAVCDEPIAVGDFSLLGVTANRDQGYEHNTLRLDTVMRIAESVASLITQLSYVSA